MQIQPQTPCIDPPIYLRSILHTVNIYFLNYPQRSTINQGRRSNVTKYIYSSTIFCTHFKFHIIFLIKLLPRQHLNQNYNVRSNMLIYLNIKGDAIQLDVRRLLLEIKSSWKCIYQKS